MFRKTLTIGIAMLLFVTICKINLSMPPSALGAGNIIYVDDDNTDPPWNGTISDPYQNITSGLEHASYGDIVHVFSGTYTENVVVNKSITLRGDSKPIVDGMGGIGINVTVYDDFGYGVTIDGFNITNCSYGIYFVMQDIENLYNTSLIIGDIILANNTISSSLDGIYAYVYDVGVYMYGNSTLTMGDFRIADNIINSDQMGIVLDEFTYIGYDMNGTSSFSMGNIEITNNTVTSASEGIYIYEFYELGYYMYDESSFTMGSIMINDNTIESDSYGIMMDYFEYFGNYMEDNSKFTMGNIEFSHNTINSIDEGIYIYEFYELGCYMYDNARFMMGNICFNENIINSSDYEGIWFGWGDMGYFGYSMYDNSSFEMGNIEFSGNTINSQYDGMYIDAFYEYGYHMYNSSTFTMGSILVNDNTINSGEEGIYVDGFDYFAEDLYNSSSFMMNNIEFCRNTINSTYDGIYIYEFYGFGDGMNHNSSFTMNDILVNNNTIHSDDDGICIDYIEYLGRGMYGYSSFEMGNIEFSGNTINSLYDGMYFYKIHAFGEGMYNYSSFTMEDFSIHHNTITGGRDGIQIDNFERFGTNVYDNAVFSMENLEFDSNDVSFSNSGMNFTMLENAIIRNNKIWNCSYGIQLIKSTDNLIYHNKFINNTVQAYATLNYTNAWDDNYPSGGNYWNEYIDVDVSHGPYQNLTGNDGIWDHPYVINANNTDRYPFSYLYDSEPPTIEIPLRTPSGDVLPYQEVTVTVNITDNVSGVKNVTLYYTTDDGAQWNSTQMQKNPLTDLYLGIIPGQEFGTTVRFKIEAFDYAGNNATRDGTGPYCTYPVVPEFTALTILPLFVMATLLAVVLFRRKHSTNARVD